LSRNRIKYIRSLKIKRYRDLNGQFVAEGDKIIQDCISQQSPQIEQLIATSGWLANHAIKPEGNIKEITEVSNREFDQISSLDSPSGVMAVINVPKIACSGIYAQEGISLVLDNIQDPGNLGTIIRTASWFGISMIFCSPDCADCYNPKVVQASMGAVLQSIVCYIPLPELLKKHANNPDFKIYGTFMSGDSIWEKQPCRNALIVFGNESKGISTDLLPFIDVRLHIPSRIRLKISSAESLNVAAAAAIVCAVFTR
ncbi:MAG: RNA methyltransferase, partial [Bacteroidales bacterium]|nr:RNA methyltransferase [Bacteroidales bacterium]